MAMITHPLNTTPIPCENMNSPKVSSWLAVSHITLESWKVTLDSWKALEMQEIQGNFEEKREIYYSEETGLREVP